MVERGAAGIWGLPRQRYHSSNFANGEILEVRLRLIASAVGFGNPLIAGRKGCDQSRRAGISGGD